MDKDRKNLYYLSKIGDCKKLEHEIAGIKGVVFSHVDEEKLTLEYKIDEWASDYDIFTEVMQKVADNGGDIDFERSDENSEENSGKNSNGSENSQAVSIKKDDSDVENPLSAESAENLSDSDNPDSDKIELPPETAESEDEEDNKKKDKKSKLSDNMWRVIELGLSVICFIIAMVLKNQTAKFIFLAVSFAVAGYDALYEAWIKITKKIILSDELIICLAAFACILIGKIEYAVAAMVLYSVVNFARKVITQRIDKSGICWDNPEKVRIIGERGIAEKDYNGVAVGEVAAFYKAERISFDSVLQSEKSSVLGEDGKVRQLNRGDKIFAGEIAIENADIKIEKIGNDCLYSGYNEYAKKALSSGTKFSEFAKNKEQIYNIFVLLVCLAITFIMPIFNKYGYKNGLYVWGYKAAILAAISGLGYYVFSCHANISSALHSGRKYGAILGGLKNAAKISSSKELYIDEDILFENSGELKADSRGAIHELKDGGIGDITFATVRGDEKGSEICKELKIPSICNRNSESEKSDAILAANKNGANIALNSSDFITDCEENNIDSEENTNSEESADEKAQQTSKKTSKTIDKKGGVICFNCKDGGYKGDGAVMKGGIANLPYLIKLAKRTTKIDKFALGLGLAAKILLAGLALSGFVGLFLAVLVDSVISIGAFLISFFNGGEVY